MGGTTVDVCIGQNILHKKGIYPKAIYVSQDPITQSYMQTDNLEKLERKVIELILLNKPDILIVFCNSLSFALNWQIIEQKTGCIIHDLKNPYIFLLKDMKLIALLTADCVTLHRISNFLHRVYPDIKLYGYAMLPLVELFEKQSKNIKSIINQLYKISIKLAVDAFIIGCTHFENYNIYKQSTTDILFPGKFLLDQIFGENRS